MKKYYNKLPPFIQKVLFNIYGFVIILKRYNLTFYKVSNTIRHNELTEDMRSYNIEKLKIVYNEAEKLDYWKKSFKELKINNFESFVNEFKTIPIINNKVVNHNFNNMYKRESKYSVIQSSGSTGNPTKILRNKNFEPIQWAFWWRYRNNLGIQRREWSAVFSSKMISSSKNDLYRINYFTKQIYFNSYMLNSSAAKLILNEIKKRKIKWIHGFPSSIVIIAKENLNQKILSEKDISWITTGGENLSLNNKNLIEKSFNCMVREHYGLAEGVVNISECKLGHLHVDEDFSYVEFIPSDLGGYHLIGTSYFNTIMPLIRYDTGDLVTNYKDSNCEFHRGRIVDEIDGRKDDHIILPDKTKLGRLSILFSPFKSINEAQIIQDSENNINILISVTDDFDERVESSFKDHIDSYLLNRISYKIIKTNKFERTKNSKHRLVVRKLGDKL